MSRDPRDVALSFFKYLQGWFFEAGEVDVNTFVKDVWLQLDHQQHAHVPGGLSPIGLTWCLGGHIEMIRMYCGCSMRI